MADAQRSDCVRSDCLTLLQDKLLPQYDSKFGCCLSCGRGSRAAAPSGAVHAAVIWKHPRLRALSRVFRWEGTIPLTGDVAETTDMFEVEDLMSPLFLSSCLHFSFLAQTLVLHRRSRIQQDSHPCRLCRTPNSIPQQRRKPPCNTANLPAHRCWRRRHR